MKENVMRALGHFAIVSDVDTLGYLAGEELMAAQQARVELDGQQKRLALEYLHRFHDPKSAKQQLRQDIAGIEADTINGRFSDDEARLLERFAEALDPEIDRLGERSLWQRNALRLFLKIPSQIVVLVPIAAAAAAIVALIAKTFIK